MLVVKKILIRVDAEVPVDCRKNLGFGHGKLLDAHALKGVGGIGEESVVLVVARLFGDATTVFLLLLCPQSRWGMTSFLASRLCSFSSICRTATLL